MSKRKTGNRNSLAQTTGERAIGQEVSAIKLDQLIDLTYGSLKTYTDKFNWRNIREAIGVAMNYARGASELIQSAIMMKVEFFGAGFKVKIDPGRDSSTKSLNDRIKDWMALHDIRQICDDLLFDLLAADNCILQWQVNKTTGKIDYVTTLPPDTVVMYPGNSDRQLGIFITSELKEEVLMAIMKGQQKNWSPKLVAAVKTGKPEVIFAEADGEYWILKSRGPKFVGLRSPSMKSIFADIQLREMLVAGDWSTAYFTKNFITLVTMGESIKQGPNAGTRKLYPDKKDMDAVQAQFKRIGTTMRLYGNHTLNVKYIYPDQNVLGNEKYAGVERRIMRWTRVPDAMITGEGDGYAQSTLAKRSFEAQGERCREDIADVFGQLFDHPSIQDDPTLNIPSKSTVKVTFNRQVLKDPKQVLDEISFMNDAGWMDVETGLEDMGRDYQEIKERKAQDKEDKELWQPVFEPSQGMMTPGKDPEGGRPPTDPTKKSGRDGPRPSRGQ